LDYFVTFNSDNITILPGYVHKVISNLITKEPESVLKLIIEYKITCLQMVSHIDNDSVADTIYMLTTLDNELLKVVFNEIDKNFNSLIKGNGNNELLAEKIKNLILVVIRFHKKLMNKGFNNIEGYSNCIELYLSNFNILSKYIKVFLDIQLLESWHVKGVQNLYLLFEQFLAALYSDEANENNMLTKQYIDSEISIGNTLPTNENLNDEFKAVSSSIVVDRLILQPEDIDKVFLLYYVIYLDFYKLADKIRNESNTLPTLNEANSIKCTSEIYLLFLDVTIILAQMRKDSFLTLIADIKSLIISLLNTVLIHPNNSLLQIKVLKIIEIFLFDDFYILIRETLLDIIIEYFRQNLPSMHFKDLINLENKCLLNKSLSTLNTAFLFKLIQLFYNLQKNQTEIKNNPFIEVEDYILVYIDISSKDLLSKEIQAKEDLKNAGDEEIKLTEKNCKFF
jgi:hypothetical protein